jgi:regulator of sigma E protease
VVREISFRERSKNGAAPTWSSWGDMASVRDKGERVYDEWGHYDYMLQQVEMPAVKLRVNRGGTDLEVGPIEAEVDPAWPRTERGFLFMPDFRQLKADGFVDAIGLGIGRTMDFIQRIYLTLTSLLKGRVSANQLGGPITIAYQTYSAADLDFTAFILSLGVISINLAVVNFLPIPLLDGGHMVMLLYEKLRGKPAPELVRVIAAYAGLACILALMVFVFYNDIMRFDIMRFRWW